MKKKKKKFTPTPRAIKREAAMMKAGPVTVSPEQKTDMIVRKMFALLDYTKAVKAVVIAFLCGPEKYYMLRGYKTEQQFMEERAGLSRSQGIRYKEVGQKFLELFPLNLDDENVSKRHISGDENLPIPMESQKDFENLAAFIEQIGFHKFHELTRFNIDMEAFHRYHRVILADGQEVPLDDVINSSAKKLLADIESLQHNLDKTKKELTTERTQSSEQIKKLTEERELFLKRYHELRDIERKWGPINVSTNEKLQVLGEALAEMRFAARKVRELRLGVDEVETVRSETAMLIWEMRLLEQWLLDDCADWLVEMLMLNEAGSTWTPLVRQAMIRANKNGTYNPPPISRAAYFMEHGTVDGYDRWLASLPVEVDQAGRTAVVVAAEKAEREKEKNGGKP